MPENLFLYGFMEFHANSIDQAQKKIWNSRNWKVDTAHA
jgi:hypothetical protein